MKDKIDEMMKQHSFNGEDISFLMKNKKHLTDKHLKRLGLLPEKVAKKAAPKKKVLRKKK